MTVNTLFLRLEGPLQAWGSHESKFGIRRSMDAPTKSGVIGLMLAALGISREAAGTDWLQWFSDLEMGVRIDRPGVRWWDWHTVGAKMMMRIADGGSKRGAMLTRREYLCDASFLVALRGDPALIADLKAALKNPVWTLYLGRKCCPPSRPILEPGAETGEYSDLVSALASVPWRPRLRGESLPKTIDCLYDWRPSPGQPEAPDDAEVWYDVPLSLDPPAHRPRFVIRREMAVGGRGNVNYNNTPMVRRTPAPPRPRANYREERLELDQGLCVFCKSPATTVQHITYRHAGGGESLSELRALCRLCHDAVTMIEYGLGMGLDRINPEEPRWRAKIIEKRGEIVEFRSEETRKRLFSRQGLRPETEEVE